jgi:hypothetical protein
MEPRSSRADPALGQAELGGHRSAGCCDEDLLGVDGDPVGQVEASPTVDRLRPGDRGGGSDGDTPRLERPAHGGGGFGIVAGRSRLICSMTVTVVPSRAKASAISQPTGPPPRITIDAGCRSRRNTDSFVRTSKPSSPGIVGTTGLDPVANTICDARTRLPSTLISEPDRSVARPSSTSMCSRPSAGRPRRRRSSRSTGRSPGGRRPMIRRPRPRPAAPWTVRSRRRCTRRRADCPAPARYEPPVGALPGCGDASGPAADHDQVSCCRPCRSRGRRRHPPAAVGQVGTRFSTPTRTYSPRSRSSATMASAPPCSRTARPH